MIYKSPKVLKEVEKEGMPVVDEKRKGNLFIKFNIVFPKQLSEEAKSELKELLKWSSSLTDMKINELIIFIV